MIFANLDPTPCPKCGKRVRRMSTGRLQTHGRGRGRAFSTCQGITWDWQYASRLGSVFAAWGGVARAARRAVEAADAAVIVTKVAVRAAIINAERRAALDIDDGVARSAPCRECNAYGYHAPGCPEIDA